MLRLSNFDRWLTDDERTTARPDEIDPRCRDCGRVYSDHPTIVIPATEDDWAYDLTVCPTDPRVGGRS